jgi:cobyrinic acid a,c-diamide synthase
VKPPRILVVAGAGSGVGKTTVTLGLLEAVRRRGLTVQGFKVGPDFIDPGFHAIATGRGSYNLDGWMCGRDHVLATIARHAADVDLALIEGVMGCFDGLDATSPRGRRHRWRSGWAPPWFWSSMLWPRPAAQRPWCWGLSSLTQT